MITDRNLDGAYFRIQRDGKWENVCFSDMTPEQMHKVLERKDLAFLTSLCVLLAQRIREIGDQFGIVRE